MKKNLNKVIALALALIAVFALVGCGGSNNLVGRWNLSGLTIEAMDMMEMLKSMGQDTSIFYLELREDATFSLNFMDNSSEGTWEETENGVKMTIDGEDVEFILDGNVLTAEYNGSIMRLTKE